MASIAMFVYQRVYSVYSINPLFIPYEPYPIVNGELPHYYPIMIFFRHTQISRCVRETSRKYLHKRLSSKNSTPRKAPLLLFFPSGYVKIAIEHGHRNSGFTH